MIYKVLSYDSKNLFHICEDESGEKLRIDLMVNGDFGNMPPEELVSEKVSIDRLVIHLALGMNVKII